MYDSIPWAEVDQQAHAGKVERPPVPSLSDHLDKTASGQEELLLGFTELVTAPTGRHVFAFLLAAFIDVIVFLLAFASGPYFHGDPEQRWPAAAASLDGADPQVFTRDFLRKFEPGAGGLASVDVQNLTPGERQLCILLAGKQLATLAEEDGRQRYLLDDRIHVQLVESLDARSATLRASRVAGATAS